MNGIDKITQRIQSDAQVEIDAINADFKAQADTIAAELATEADRQREELLARGRRQAEQKAEQIASGSHMEARKMKLAAKQKLLAESFDGALDALCSLDDERYIALLTDLLVRASSTGKEEVVFAAKDRSRIGKSVVIAANKMLLANDVQSKNPMDAMPNAIKNSKFAAAVGIIADVASYAMSAGAASLTLSETTRTMRGGFILVDGPVETNCSFESLVRLQKDQLELEVADILFP